MPYLTVPIDPQRGPVLDCFLGVSLPRADALRAACLAVPKFVTIRALLDTGASMSAVDPAALASFNLVPTGTVPIVTPSTGASPHFAKQYDVSIMFPTGFQIGALGVCACQLRDQGINALFGRDVLAKCLFQYDGKASRYILAF